MKGLDELIPVAAELDEINALALAIPPGNAAYKFALMVIASAFFISHE